jgi:phosphoribosyl 1,2-cyclic phosphate phosphodiesterase
VLGEGGERILVDPGPEFRLQALRAGIDRLDAVLVTHAHADHIHGLDDVRPLTREGPLPVWANREARAELEVRFSYAFNPPQRGGGVPRITLAVLPPEGVRIGGIRVLPVPVMHGILPILGFRLGNFAYLTDCSEIPDTSLPVLKDVKILVLGALRERPHPTHFSISEAAEAARSLGVREAWITHLCHDHSHRDLEKICSDLSSPGFTVRPAWDGMELELRGG